jgi:glycolate oxidase iron-sulfur subunit
MNKFNHLNWKLKRKRRLTPMLNHVPELKNQLKKCVRCGQCRAVCPIFDELRIESAAPRGKVFLAELLQKKEIGPTDEVAKHLNKCLMCEACYVECPSKIPVHKYVALARTYVANDQNFNAKKLIYGKVWASPTLLGIASFFLKVYHNFGFRSLFKTLGLNKLLPGDLPRAENILQQVPKTSAKQKLAEVTQAKGAKKYRVGYFLGCGTDIFYPEIAQSVVDVLVKNNCEVVIPKGIKCCGMPQYGNGAADVAKDLAKHNLNIFKQAQVDYIITDCGTCISTLKHNYLDWFKGTPFEAEAQEFANKAYDISEFLVDVVKEINPNLGTLSNTTITYHDSCHLGRAAKITKQPREILKMIPGINFVEMADANRCCGGAGSFCLTNYDISMGILNKKIENVTATKAEMVATCCPMCTMQIAHGLKENGQPSEVVHPIVLLNKAYLAYEDQKPNQESA